MVDQRDSGEKERILVMGVACCAAVRLNTSSLSVMRVNVRPGPYKQFRVYCASLANIHPLLSCIKHQLPGRYIDCLLGCHLLPSSTEISRSGD